jgi:6-methylsalicylate decarboxylase
MASHRIDIHTHAMSADVAAALAARGFKPTGGYEISVQWTPEAALAYMDRQGIAAQVVSMPMAFVGSDADRAFGTRTCRMINEAHADLIATHPGRFGAFASLPADGPEHALTELAYALDELNLDGVVLTSNVAGHYFGDPFLEPASRCSDSAARVRSSSSRLTPRGTSPTGCTPGSSNSIQGYE